MGNKMLQQALTIFIIKNQNLFQSVFCISFLKQTYAIKIHDKKEPETVMHGFDFLCEY